MTQAWQEDPSATAGARTATLYFCQRSRQIALDATRVYADGFATRVLPLFDKIEDEAQAAADQAWEDAMSSPAGDYSEDPSAFAEAAREYGIEVYENLKFSQQQLLGLGAAGLYHLWERLLKQFICKELRGWTFDGCDIRAILAPADFRNLERFLSEFGYQIAQQPSYRELNELRLVANVVKHGDGKSCEELAALAPQLFEGYGYHFDVLSKADSLELSAADFARYAQAVTGFWDSFPENLALIGEG